MLGILLAVSDEKDHSRIKEIYLKYYSNMLRMAKCKLRSAKNKNFETDAEDVVHNSFLKIIKYIDRIDFSLPEKTVDSYIYTVLINEIRRFLSKKEPIHEDIDEYEITSPDDTLEEIMDDEQAVKIAIQKIRELDRRYSSVLAMYFTLEMSINAIAKELNLPVQTVYSRLKRGKELLAKLVQEAYSHGT